LIVAGVGVTFARIIPICKFLSEYIQYYKNGNSIASIANFNQNDKK